MRAILVFSLFLAAAPVAPAWGGVMPPAITSADALVRAMHDRYEKSWYRTLTFVQKTTEYAADGTSKTSTWYEALSSPGKLRIDFDPVAEGNGILFADDTIYTIEGGAVKDKQNLVHPLLVLGFDVYAQPAEVTLEKLKGLGFDLSKLHEDTWKGKAVYVVGAAKGDTRAPQFWIEKDSLLFVRMVRPSRRDPNVAQEVVFDRYERAGGGWVAAEVLFSVDGKLETRESYSEIRTGMDLDARLFDPAEWRAVHWHN